jgi:TATA-box binding protein (TBP) (component of TFIID and TFIIIB)
MVQLKTEMNTDCYGALIKALEDTIIIHKNGKMILIKEKDMYDQKEMLNTIKDIVRDFDLEIKNIDY